MKNKMNATLCRDLPSFMVIYAVHNFSDLSPNRLDLGMTVSTQVLKKQRKLKACQHTQVFSIESNRYIGELCTVEQFNICNIF